MKIEKNIELPKGRGDNRYPFPEMDISDSFALNYEKEKDIRLLRTAASIYGKRNNKKFSVRKMSKGVRCWRVE